MRCHLGPSSRSTALKRRAPSSQLRTLWAFLVQLMLVKAMSWVAAAGLFVLAATTTVVAVAGSPTAGPISVGTVVVSDVEADCAGAAGSQGLSSVESSAAASVASTVGGVTASPVAIAKESSLKADGED